MLDDFSVRRVLVIGSGADLRGRRMGNEVDFSRRWDVVARLNKVYGARLDVGRRCELAFIRWRGWRTMCAAGPGMGGCGAPWWPQDVRCGVRRWVVLNEFQGIGEDECRVTAAEAGVEKPSCGLLAVAWLLNRGARQVDLVGFGFDGVRWCERKIYADGGVDGNGHYDWEQEHAWYERQARVRLL